MLWKQRPFSADSARSFRLQATDWIAAQQGDLPIYVREGSKPGGPRPVGSARESPVPEGRAPTLHGSSAGRTPR